MLTDRLDELLKSIRAIQNTALIISFVSLAALVGLRGNLADRASRELDAVRHQGFDERFVRTWMFYLSYCEAAFLAGNTDVCQFTLTRD